MFPVTKPRQCVSVTLTSNYDTEIQDSVATMKVCRVCLAMNVKMYHISEHNLRETYKQVTGVEINTEDKLPQMLCWECVARLTSANNFRETALNIHWILLAKIVDDKCITISDIESIDRAQYQFESTLGFKYYEANNTDLHIQEDSDGHDFNEANEEVNTDSHHEIEQIYVGPNTEKVTIKSECLDETEQEADFQIPISVITKKEILSDEEMTFDEISIELTLEDQERGVCGSSMTSLSNQRSEALSHCKELRVDFNSSKHSIQDSFNQITAHSSKDSGFAHHPQIKEEILDNNFAEKITIYVPGINTSTVDSNISLFQDDGKPSKNMFVCDICGETFHIKKTLIQHVGEHSKMYDCTSDINSINSMHIKNTALSCNYCGYECFSKYRLSEHINSKHTKNISYNCSLCNYKASYKCVLARHINARHTKTDIYNCALCDYSAYDKGTLSKHINAKHTKVNVHRCSLCSFKTYQKGYLNVHVNAVHTKTNAFNCPYCSFKTYKKFNLSAHVNAKHTKVNVYNCTLCSYNAYDKSTLSKHINAKHTKTHVYNCTLCDYITYDKNSLAKHTNAKHTKNNSYNCSHCDYTTYDRSALSKHNNSKHTKNVSYNCSLCSYKTYRRSTLSKHINAKHTKSISYDCTLCSYKAYQKSNLTTHMNVKHSTSTVNSCDAV